MANLSKIHVSGHEFATDCYGLLKTDNDVNIGVGGFTGVGKTRFSVWLCSIYSKISGMPWGLDHLTWSRKELLEWVDGKKGSKPDPYTKLKKNQLPKYSAICPDELFYMFYKRTWFDKDQIDGVKVFNSCRDRRLFNIGNVPDFWDLDGGFIKRIRFYVYIPTRGLAWVFQQENNPFTKDPWNVTENKKLFRKHKNPYKCPNFICEIEYPDWEPKDKRAYEQIRNTKRVKALTDNRQKQERYGEIKEQRDSAFQGWFDDRKQISDAISSCCDDCKGQLDTWTKPPTNEVMAQVVGISKEAVRLVKIGGAVAGSKKTR